MKAVAFFGSRLIHQTIIMTRYSAKIEEEYKQANVYLQRCNNKHFILSVYYRLFLKNPDESDIFVLVSQ